MQLDEIKIPPVNIPQIEPEQNPNLLTNSGEATNFWQKIRMNNNLNFSIYKIIAVALTIQGLIGIYKSISFIMVEYPDLEQKLENHLINQEEINHFASKAIVMLASTILSMFFALRISIIQSKVAKTINAVIGAALFFANTWINNYLKQIHSAEIISQLFFSILNEIKAFFK